MKKEPINKEAFGYVRLHTCMSVSEDEFIVIEKYVAEMHNSFYRNESYGDADLRNFVYQKLTEESVFIEQSKADAIANALYDYMSVTGCILPIDWVGKFDKWCDWRQSLSDAISDFILYHEYIPNIIIMPNYTKSQIEFISQITAKSDYEEIKTILKFQIDNVLSNKRFILLFSLDDDDDRNDTLKVKDPSPIFSHNR